MNESEWDGSDGKNDPSKCRRRKICAVRRIEMRNGELNEHNAMRYNLNTVKIYYLVIRLANLHNPNLFKLIFVCLLLTFWASRRRCWPCSTRTRFLVCVSFLAMFPCRWRLSTPFRLFSLICDCLPDSAMNRITVASRRSKWKSSFTRPFNVSPPFSTCRSCCCRLVFAARCSCVPVPCTIYIAIEFLKWMLFTLEKEGGKISFAFPHVTTLLLALFCCDRVIRQISIHSVCRAPSWIPFRSYLLWMWMEGVCVLFLSLSLSFISVKCLFCFAGTMHM